MHKIIAAIATAIAVVVVSPINARPTTTYISQTECTKALSGTVGGAMTAVFAANDLSQMNANGNTFRSDCTLSTDIPAGGYEACKEYTVTVTTSNSQGNMVSISAGKLANDASVTTSKVSDTCRGQQSSTKSTKYKLQAPQTGALDVIAICGDQGGDAFSISSKLSAAITGAPASAACPALQNSAQKVSISSVLAVALAIVFTVVN